jgi:phage shock protein PspC (stress-responsive transcriptional regulator)
MNYYSDREIEQVIEEGDRQPVAATRHVALITDTTNTPKKNRTAIKASLFGGFAFGFVLLANLVQLPPIVLSIFAGTAIGVFVYITIRGEK